MWGVTETRTRGGSWLSEALTGVYDALLRGATGVRCSPALEVAPTKSPISRQLSHSYLDN